jgi:hypothetical protein
MQNASANNHTSKPIKNAKEKWKKKEVPAVHQLPVAEQPAKHPHRKVLLQKVLHRQVVLLPEEVLPAEQVQHLAGVHQAALLVPLLQDGAVLPVLLQAVVVHHLQGAAAQAVHHQAAVALQRVVAVHLAANSR